MIFAFMKPSLGAVVRENTSESHSTESIVQEILQLGQDAYEQGKEAAEQKEQEEASTSNAMQMRKDGFQVEQGDTTMS